MDKDSVMRLALILFCLVQGQTLSHANTGLRQLSIPLPLYKHSKTPLNKGLNYRSGHVLVKFSNEKYVSVLPVPVSQESEIVAKLRTRPDVEFAEIDLILEPQHFPDDPLATNQWHHSIIDTFGAWEFLPSASPLRLAIVDPPFQMNHPDLSPNVVAGWDVLDGVPITSSLGVAHSTLSAGMAAAVINNATGIAGVANCKLLPINVNGALSEIAAAIYWAADNNVRVVSISWTGASNDTLNAAALYHKEKTRGIVAMAGVNGSGFLDYPNQPHIYCVSMTDAADNMRSRHGNHIDFAAPGYEVFSTTINSGYSAGTGTSYATPLFAGVVAGLFSINPLLSGADVIEILKSSALDLGTPGWDQFFGWGRINYAAAAQAAWQSRPRILSIEHGSTEITIVASNPTGSESFLLRSEDLTNWEQVSDVTKSTDNNTATFKTTPLPGRSWFKVEYVIVN